MKKASDASGEEITPVLDKKAYCPVCYKELLLKQGACMLPYFSHYPNEACDKGLILASHVNAFQEETLFPLEVLEVKKAREAEKEFNDWH